MLERGDTITTAKAFDNFNYSNNAWDPAGATSNRYLNTFTYDANGNILTQNRHDETGQQFEKLTYWYAINDDNMRVQNRLYHVNDPISSGAMPDDIDDQGAFTPILEDINTDNNYGYDQLGQLQRDRAEYIEQIHWRVDGKISRIDREDGSGLNELEFVYDAMGQRIAKKVFTDTHQWESTTYYIRDAQGNVMSTYEHTVTQGSASLKLSEQHLYGSSRIGMRTPEEEMIGAQAPDENGLFELTRGMKRYELTNHLGNVLSVITDTKQAVYNNPPSVLSYYQSEVISYMDYYAYGAILSGRCFNNTHYRFSYNKQEKTDEISGAGNHTTAKYWEYDTRLGRRWNLDPIFNTDISRYAVNGNNPIYYLDPKGDFKTKFGANVYKFFHGGTVTQAQYGDRKGEYYVHKRVDGGKGAKGDGKTNLDEVVVAEEVRWNWGDGGKDHPGNVLDNGVDFVQRNASNAWNSPLARYIIPDYVTISGSFQTSSGIYMNEELTFTLMLRGKDPGLYFNTTTGFGAVTSVGVDVGCSVGKGYYLGDARKLSSSMLGGWQGSGSAGVGLKAIAGGSLNGGVDVGFDDNGQPVTITGKVGVSVGVGVSTPVLQGGLGTGKATNAIPIFKF